MAGDFVEKMAIRRFIRLSSASRKPRPSEAGIKRPNRRQN
jgi:hypothetical protein